ncbi:hypothetical protein D3C85_1502480 [compost metagenome]
MLIHARLGAEQAPLFLLAYGIQLQLREGQLIVAQRLHERRIAVEYLLKHRGVRIELRVLRQVFHAEMVRVYEFAAIRGFQTR